MIAPRLGLAPLLALACCGGGTSTTDAGTSTGVGSTTAGPGSTGVVTTGAGLTTGEDDSASEEGSVGSSGALTSDTAAVSSNSSTSDTSSTGDAFTTGAGTTGEPMLVCPDVADPVMASDIDDEDIAEASGIVASRTQPGVFWLHNDSGDQARFFAVDAGGQRIGVFNVGGAEAVDWEDMSSGPGTKPGEYLYFGDIGDNGEERDKITVYRVPEPDAAAAGGGEVDLADVEIIDLVYPDEAHNAETLIVDPQTGDLVIVAKGDPTRVFLRPGPVEAGGPYVLEEVAPIDFSPVVATGGDISPGGEFIAVRTYTVALLWLRPPGTSIAEAFAGEPCEIPLAFELQGEALTFAGDGGGYYTLGEGSDVPLYWYAFQ